MKVIDIPKGHPLEKPLEDAHRVNQFVIIELLSGKKLYGFPQPLLGETLPEPAKEPLTIKFVREEAE